jgi:hypothetical protein
VFLALPALARHLAARIAGEHPDVLERMKASQFPSARQAAIAAGQAPWAQSKSVHLADTLFARGQNVLSSAKGISSFDSESQAASILPANLFWV